MIWKKGHPKSHMGYPDLWTWPDHEYTTENRHAARWADDDLGKP